MKLICKLIGHRWVGEYRDECEDRGFIGNIGLDGEPNIYDCPCYTNGYKDGYEVGNAALAVDDENARLREALQDRVYLEERAALAVASEVAQLRETAALARKFIVMNTAYTHDQRDVTNAIDAALGDEGERDDITELHGAMPRCSCGKWTTYVGTYDADGQTVRCHGCLRAIGKCRCR